VETWQSSPRKSLVRKGENTVPVLVMIEEGLFSSPDSVVSGWGSHFQPVRLRVLILQIQQHRRALFIGLCVIEH
jgi:hypothetical protein